MYVHFRHFKPTSYSLIYTYVVVVHIKLLLVMTIKRLYISVFVKIKLYLIQCTLLIYEWRHMSRFFFSTTNANPMTELSELTETLSVSGE